MYFGKCNKGVLILKIIFEWYFIFKKNSLKNVYTKYNLLNWQLQHFNEYLLTCIPMSEEIVKMCTQNTIYLITVIAYSYFNKWWVFFNMYSNERKYLLRSLLSLVGSICYCGGDEITLASTRSRRRAHYKRCWKIERCCKINWLENVIQNISNVLSFDFWRWEIVLKDY